MCDSLNAGQNSNLQSANTFLDDNVAKLKYWELTLSHQNYLGQKAKRTLNSANCLILYKIFQHQTSSMQIILPVIPKVLNGMETEWKYGHSDPKETS